MSRVTVIPAKLDRATFMPLDKPIKRRVAGYARVSTDSEEQQTSYEAQVSYYTEYIQKRDDWEFAGVYTDQGISATNTKHRDGFNRMIADALDGKIDLIVTKSVSRFARNTVDSLTTVRKLKEKGVEVYFEKENIYTLDSTFHHHYEFFSAGRKPIYFGECDMGSAKAYGGWQGHNALRTILRIS